jgi:hypothetical protein
VYQRHLIDTQETEGSSKVKLKAVFFVKDNGKMWFRRETLMGKQKKENGAQLGVLVKE